MTRIDDVAKRLEHAAEDIHNYSPDFSQGAADFLHGDAAWLVRRVKELEEALDALIASWGYDGDVTRKEIEDATEVLLRGKA